MKGLTQDGWIFTVHKISTTYSQLSHLFWWQHIVPHFRDWSQEETLYQCHFIPITHSIQLVKGCWLFLNVVFSESTCEYFTCKHIKSSHVENIRELQIYFFQMWPAHGIISHVIMLTPHKRKNTHVLVYILFSVYILHMLLMCCPNVKTPHIDNTLTTYLHPWVHSNTSTSVK